MLRWIFRFLFVACFLFLCVVGWVGTYAFTAAPGNGDPVTVYIPRGSGVIRIQYLLSREHLVKEDPRFLLLVRILQLTNRLKAGEFVFSSNMTPLEVLQVLEKGRPVRHSIVIREGLTMAEIAALLTSKTWIDGERFLQLSRNPDKIAAFGIEADSLEGYLFPDTYSMVRGETDADRLIDTMVGRFQSLYERIRSEADPQKKKAAAKLSRHEVVTLASIIEKETGRAEERPLISRVFLNRLTRGMRLQADPTVIYGLVDFNGNITRADLKRPTPYNTYIIKGLPPGPICNPGKAAIMAVFQPAEGKYLYFVSKNDGTHYFSKTLREHNKAVKKYQQRKKKG